MYIPYWDYKYILTFIGWFNRRMKKILKFLPLIIAAFILYFLIYPNYENIIRVYHESKRTYLLISMLAALGSYFFMSLSLYEMLKIMGHKIPFLQTFSITMISTAVNYFFSTAGASGFAIRTHLLNKRKVPVSICITTSVVLTAFIYLILGFIVFQSFILHMISIKKINLQVLEGFIGTLFIFLIPFLLTLIMYNHRFRNRWAIRIYYFVNSTIYQITKYQIPKEDFREFKNQLNHGVSILHKKRYELHKVLFYVLLDWVFNIMVLYFAFLSLDIKLSLVKIIIGFSFGMIMTVIPILPSGLGAMEFVIANFYSNYGVPIESAIFASLVFRVSYYIIPSLVSLVMFYGIKIAEPEIKYDANKKEDI